MTDVAVQVAPDGVLLDATYVVNGSGATVARLNVNAESTSGETGALAAGVYNSALPTLTNGQQSPLQLDSVGRLIVEPTSPVGASSMVTGQVDLSGSPTLIVAARTGPPLVGRQSVLITNWGPNDVYIGGSSVTTSTGKKLSGAAGAWVSIDTTVAIYGVSASGMQPVDYIETY